MSPTPGSTEITPKTDADAVARAATAQAEKLEKQNAELKRQLAAAAKGDTKALQAQLDNALEIIEGMKADQAEFRAAMEAGAAHMATKPKGPAPLEEKYKGTHTYRVNADSYRKGEFLPVGSKVTLTDERPSKSWSKIVARQMTEMVDAPAVPSGRPSDTEV